MKHPYSMLLLTPYFKPNTECGSAASCSATFTQTKGISFEWSADIDPVEWISGGFSVEISFETGTEQQCTGNTGDTICVWQVTPVTRPAS